jgi:hypothetical protein
VSFRRYRASGSRWRPRAAAGAIALAVAAAAVVTAMASPGAPPAATAPAAPPAATGAVPAGLAALERSAKLPAKAPVRRLLRRPAAFSTCPAVRAHFKEYAARHVKAVTCWTTGPGAASEIARAGTRLAAAAVTLPPPAPGCGAAPPAGVWVVGRLSECIWNDQFVGTITDVQTKALLGLEFMSLNQDITMSSNSNIVTEGDELTFLQGTMDGNAPSTWSFAPSCTANCGPLTGTQSFTLAPGQSKTGISISYRDNPATGQQDPLFSTSVTLNFTTPTSVPITPGRFSTPDGIRCDNGLGGSGTGCAIPAVTPDLVLSTATYGAAAMNVHWGEDLIPGTPGLSEFTPLTRGNPNLRQGNSDAICDNTFKRITRVVPDDSCDEYPFASSQQSGATRGLTGKDCFDIVPSGSFGAVPLFVGDLNLGRNGNEYTGLEECERGHVPSAQNNAVGGAVGAFYNQQRMIAGDPYTVTVTE